MRKQYDSPTLWLVNTWQKDVLCSSGELLPESKDKMEDDIGAWS